MSNQTYSLTLSLDERRAIDFVGHRYSTGDDFFIVLQNCRTEPEGAEWNDKGYVSFVASDVVAKRILALFEQEDNLFPLFAPDFVQKLKDFAREVDPQNFVAYFNRFVVELPARCVEECVHRGACDDDCQRWAKKLNLDHISNEDLRAELSEYGAWSNEELEDHAANINRIVWLAAGNIKDEERNS